MSSDLPPDHYTKAFAYTPHIHRDIYPAIDPTSSALSQSGKVVLITGVSSRIVSDGFAVSFAKAGAKAIILVSRDAAALEKVADSVKSVNSNVEVLTVPTDLTSSESIAKLFEQVKEKYGHVDVMVYNAGSKGPNAMTVEADEGLWWNDFDVNVKGTFLACQHYLRLLGKEKQGSIVYLSTGLIQIVFPTMGAYSISKIAGTKLMEWIAAENPNVNAVSLQPGVVQTNGTDPIFAPFAFDTPQLSGGVGVWLATDAARFLSGRCISANWDVEDLVKQKEQILAGNDLKLTFEGKLGLDQFK